MQSQATSARALVFSRWGAHSAVVAGFCFVAVIVTTLWVGIAAAVLANNLLNTRGLDNIFGLAARPTLTTH